MTKYLISFPSSAMEVPADELPSREAALGWAAKLAVACRCAQEVRAFQHDPAS